VNRIRFQIMRYCEVIIVIKPSPLLAALLALALGGCGRLAGTAGPIQRESRSIELDKSERVRVELKIPVGELEVRGGAAKLLDADFSYNVAEWKPDLRYRSAAGVGDLTIEHGGPGSYGGERKNRWDLRLNDGVPIDLRVRFGAGEARLALGSMKLGSVDIEMGAGSLRLDLRGAPSKDYPVRVRGGVGEATVYLPKDVGVSATASGGIGDISVSGLRKTGERYVNDAFGRAATTIRLDIVGGVGTIKLISE
jgi:hypothetical protein